MHRIVVTIDNKKNTNFIIRLLKNFSFLNIEETDNKDFWEAKKKGDWSPLIGILEDRDISLDDIRKKAWPKRT